MNRYLIYTIGVLLFILMGMTYVINEQKEDNKRLSNNQSSLLGDIEYYKTKDSLNVASVQELRLKQKEFKKYEKDLLSTVDNLKIKVKRLETASKVVTKTEYKVKTEIRDSLVYIEGREITLNCVSFNNKYLTIDGCVNEGHFDGLIQSRDTIEQFVHRVPRKFLFIKWGTKAIRQEVLSKNPYTEIVYTKYIELD